jgi:hypothetical protein
MARAKSAKPATILSGEPVPESDKLAGVVDPQAKPTPVEVQATPVAARDRVERYRPYPVTPLPPPIDFCPVAPPPPKPEEAHGLIGILVKYIRDAAS